MSKRAPALPRPWKQWLGCGLVSVSAGCGMRVGNLGLNPTQNLSAGKPVALTLASVSPRATSGGATQITLQGSGFVAPLSVSVGNFFCKDVRVLSSSTLTCTAPAYSRPVAMDITVADASGNQAVLPRGFFYDLKGCFSVSSAGAPSARFAHVAAWTGDHMLIWGGSTNVTGSGPGYLGTGASYDPQLDGWTNMSNLSGPSPRTQAMGVWTGSSLFVWGGVGALGALGDGAIYHPSDDSWVPVSYLGAPAARYGATVSWTGRQVIVWGGQDSSGNALNTGALYDPVANAWSPMSIVNAPVARYGHSAVWTGSQLIVWGGQNPAVNSWQFSDGGAYDPMTNSWSAIPAGPSGRYNHAAVWAGTDMIVWGGLSYGSPLNTLQTFLPATQTWVDNFPASPLSLGAAPSFAAIWTGTNLLTLAQGQIASFSPLSGSWQMGPGSNGQMAASSSSAVWTGQTVITWGGLSANGAALQSGGLCDL